MTRPVVLKLPDARLTLTIDPTWDPDGPPVAHMDVRTDDGQPARLTETQLHRVIGILTDVACDMRDAA